LIFEAPMYAAFLSGLAYDEALRLLILVNSVYLNPAADGDHIFDYGASGTPDTRYAFDGEFRLDFFVIAPDAIVLIDAMRARRLPP
jgi:hypothetical protein